MFPVAAFKKFKTRLKSTKTRFKLSAGLNLETFDTILSRGLNLNRCSNSLNLASAMSNCYKMMVHKEKNESIIFVVITLSK